MTLVGEDTNQILADNANCDMIIYVDDFANAPKDMGRHHSNCVTMQNAQICCSAGGEPFNKSVANR